MAKLEWTLEGDFDAVLRYLHDGILDRSASASWEDGSDYNGAGFRCSVRVYERYSWLGSNRVSLNLTLVGEGRRAVPLRHYLRRKSGHVSQNKHHGRGGISGYCPGAVG